MGHMMIGLDHARSGRSGSSAVAKSASAPPPRKSAGQLPTDRGPLPRLLYSVEEVAEMFGRAPDTIRETCWKHRLPYRLETTWGPGGQRFRRMVFSMRENPHPSVPPTPPPAPHGVAAAPNPSALVIGWRENIARQLPGSTLARCSR
jgi:hypothetical protein